MGEGRVARKAGGGTPLKDPAGRDRAGILLSAAAWHPLWLKWRVSLRETHLPDSPAPPAQNRLGEVFQASRRFGFTLSQGNRPTPWPAGS